MIRKLIVLSGALMLAGAWAGCVHKAVVPASPVISFANDVQPIITGNCTQSGCHGIDNPQKYTLTSYDNIMGIVTAGDANKSKLFTSVVKLGDDIMPKSPAAPLTDTQIKYIYLWILQGAKNN